MRKTYLSGILIFIFLIAFLPYEVSSQIRRTTTSRMRPSVFTIEFVPSYSQPLPNLSGSSIADLFSFKGYGVNSGIGTHINFKLSANKKGTLRPMMTLGYNLFMGSDEFAYIETNRTESFPKPGNHVYTSKPGSSKMYMHDFRAGLGLAYEFANKKNRWVPHLGLTFDLNILFGTYKQDPVSSVGGVPPNEVSFTIKNATRFGFSFGGGVHYRATRAFGVIFTTNIRHANLLGKNSELAVEENKFHLLDKANTNLNDNLTKSRQIVFFDFGLGAAFFIGRK